ncbi:GDSL family lipase [Acidovorax sp. SRB_14]|uniref:SGNH/GDSL hydrolase family protein n=1 Tax=Acidovorax sp. SRB_14 TaxID=1962699 RepID=UPI0015666915|nr:SGNH/GDSL hydrolase family protein [Acidovorax sp. SRB_14]NMM82508.1 GDSL family lipase [Acidovorax sp. SRB_14]
MAANWMRRTVLVAACASAALLAACGSSTIESALTPDRFVALGGALNDLGKQGSSNPNNWAQQLASRYDNAIPPVALGSQSVAPGNARITAKPDAVGNASTLTLEEQINQIPAGSLGADNLVFISAGISDLIAGMAAVHAEKLTRPEMVAVARKAGQDLAMQVRRLVNAGAKHVVVTGTYDLGKTPWATDIDEVTLLHDASSAFNEGLLVNMVDLGANVLYVDSAYFVNLLISSPGSYGFDNATTPVCTSKDADNSNSIGIGTGQVSSALCTTGTLRANPEKYVFSDPVYLTPAAQRQLGNYAYDRLHARW